MIVHTPSSEQTIVPPKAQDTTIKTPALKGRMRSAASRRLRDISRGSIIDKIKVQVQKDLLGKHTNIGSCKLLGRKGQRGRDLSYIHLPAPEDMQYLDKQNLECYDLLRRWYNPIQNLRYNRIGDQKGSTEKMLWTQVLSLYPAYFPEEPVPKGATTLSSRASCTFAKLSKILEFEMEKAEEAQDAENPQFVFPDEDRDSGVEDVEEEVGEAYARVVALQVETVHAQIRAHAMPLDASEGKTSVAAVAQRAEV
ncbi:hypothetical protein EYC80_009869 [Monilinia laxa]|uniref:Uncharacterized protein n=1 Tax=Monilinia laxa TaxID=61186 RepID=A0A5N6JSB8_MONLA|nr:hypothetical protein EYC80_009869 [Monilinia laxa]